MSLETQSLEFGEFLLDLKEKTLLRNGERLPINPKTYHLLVALIEEHGHLVEKDVLMKALWPDSFVEEANLAFTVSLLRKTLGDDAHRPRFVETIPRRGYRFIAEVTEASGAGVIPPNASEESALARPILKWRPLAAGLILLLLISAATGIWYAKTRPPRESAPILLANFSSEQLSVDGRVKSAAISPDGKNLAYSYEADGKESVWMRDLGSSTNVQIIPPSETLYFDMAISPDGRSLYFARVQQPWPAGQQPDIFRVSVVGGVPAKVIDQAQGSISLSSDGTKISFRRCPYTDSEHCSLWIADSDGKNERRLLSRSKPIRIGDVAISPDGKRIAFGSGQSRNGSNDFGLVEIDLETGSEREITQEKFFDIWSITWLPDGSTLFLTARKNPENIFRIWKVSLATGESTVLSNDGVNYLNASLNADGSSMVCISNRPDYHLNVYTPEMNGGRPRVLADASTVSFAPNGKIVFSSVMTGNDELSMINADGSEQRQLTNDTAIDVNGLMSGDGRTVFFVSNRTGVLQIWRMNSDGTDQRQLTRSGALAPLLLSIDGQWLYFVTARERKLTRVPIAGGEEEMVWDRAYDHHFAISPDASLVSFSESKDGKTVIQVVSLANKELVASFDVPNEKTGVVQSAWSADGKDLYYVAPDSSLKNNAIWQQPLDGKSPVRIVEIGPDQLRETRAFAVSPDGKKFAVIQGSWKHDAVLLKGLR